MAQEEKVKYSLFDAGLILGFNATQVDGDNVAGYNKVGVNTGATAFIRFHKNMSFSFEMLYSQKGSKSELNLQNSINSYKLWLDYIDVPILFNVHDKNIAIFSAGVSIGRLIRFKEEIDGYETTDNYEVNPYDDWDYNVIGSIIFLIKEHWGINLRGAYSLSSIRPQDHQSRYSNGPQRNNVLSLRGLYIF